jgi:hypothetical protein
VAQNMPGSGTIALVAIAMVGAVACASPRGWVRAGETEADFNRNSYECAREATFASRRAAITEGSGFLGEEAKTSKDLYRTCMRARGYQLVQGGEWRGFRD